MTPEKLLAIVRITTAITTEHLQSVAWFVLNLPQTYCSVVRVAGAIADLVARVADLLV